MRSRAMHASSQYSSMHTSKFQSLTPYRDNILHPIVAVRTRPTKGSHAMLNTYVRFFGRPHNTDNNYFAWKINSISDSGRIKLIWIPGHVGFALNEAADRAAKAALDLPLNSISLPLSVYLPLFVIPRELRSLLSATRRNKFSALDPQKYSHLIKYVPKNRRCPLGSYQNDYVWSRLRLNRPAVAYRGCRFANEGGFCVVCQDRAFTADHLFMFCPRYIRPRNEMKTFIERSINITPTTENILAFPSAPEKRIYNTFRRAIDAFLTTVLRDLRF